MKRKSANANIDVEDEQDKQDDKDDEAVEENEHSNVLQPIAQGRGPARRSARALELQRKCHTQSYNGFDNMYVMQGQQKEIDVEVKNM